MSALLLAILVAACGGGGEASPGAPEPAPEADRPPDVEDLRTVAGWERLFLRSWDDEHVRTLLPWSLSGNSWRHYGLAYGIDGLTAMFEATGEPRYLDRALVYVENVIDSAVPSSSLPRSPYQDGFLGWAAWDHPHDEGIRGGEYSLYESYLFRYVGKLLRAMRDAPGLLDEPAYRLRYDAILAFTKRNVWDKWMARGADEHVYRANTHMAAHWAFLALELWAVTDDAERARYRAVLDAIDRQLPNHGSSLRQQMGPHPADPRAYFWSARWGSREAPGQDVSHGNNVVAFVVEAHALGVEWTDADVERFVRTLRDHVWKGDGRYARFMDGSGEGNGWFSDGFAKLGRYDATLQRRLERHPVGRGIQLYGNGALNARLLQARE